MISGLSCDREVACFYARLVLKSTEKQDLPDWSKERSEDDRMVCHRRGQSSDSCSYG